MPVDVTYIFKGYSNLAYLEISLTIVTWWFVLLEGENTENMIIGSRSSDMFSLFCCCGLCR